MYSETYLGIKAPTDPKSVGDIVFNDGSATPYKSKLKLSTEQKSAVIAVIFYIGTDCSDDESVRTLGIGLKSSQSKLQFCELEASARFEDIDTIHDTTLNGSWNLERIGKWLREHNKIDDTDNELKYPAFYYAKNYNKYAENLETFNTGWYLPSKEEMEKVCKKKKIINAVCTLCEIPIFKNTSFWTSSQSYIENLSMSLSANAYILSFTDGYCPDFGTDKNNQAYVCVIKEFN